MAPIHHHFELCGWSETRSSGSIFYCDGNSLPDRSYGGIEEWIVKDKNVLVFGSGISGEAACALLLKEEAKVVLYDGNDKLNPEEIRAKIEGGDSESLEIVLGTLEGDRKEELLDKLYLVVMSPGVPTDLPIVNRDA